MICTGCGKEAIVQNQDLSLCLSCGSRAVDVTNWPLEAQLFEKIYQGCKRDSGLAEPAALLRARFERLKVHSAVLTQSMVAIVPQSFNLPNITAAFIAA